MVEPMNLWSYWITFKHLNSINLNHYSQACSNERLSKTTNAESVEANSCPIVISNATSDHFFDYQMKDTLSQTTTTKLYPVKKCKKNIRNNAKKIEVSLIIFTLLLIYNAKFV